MLEKRVAIPDKTHLSLILTPPADHILTTMVEIAEKSSSPVVITKRSPGPVLGSFTYKVMSIDLKHQEEIPQLYGVPFKELELFGFVIELEAKTTDEFFHITPLAFERARYLKANRFIRFWQRTSPLYVFIAALIAILSIIFVVLTSILTILVNLQQLLKPTP